MFDEHKIYDENKMRIAAIQYEANNPFASYLWNLNLLCEKIFIEIYLYFSNNRNLFSLLDQEAEIISVCEITCALNIDDYKLILQAASENSDSSISEICLEADRRSLISRLMELEAMLKDKKRILKEKEKELKDIYHSKSWILTRPLRKANSIGSLIKSKLVHKIT